VCVCVCVSTGGWDVRSVGDRGVCTAASLDHERDRAGTCAQLRVCVTKCVLVVALGLAHTVMHRQERERERVCVCVCVCARVWARMGHGVSPLPPPHVWLCVCAYMYMCLSIFLSICVCLCLCAQNNILFGHPFDLDKYNRTLDTCCLRPDLAALPVRPLPLPTLAAPPVSLIHTRACMYTCLCVCVCVCVCVLCGVDTTGWRRDRDWRKGNQSVGRPETAHRTGACSLCRRRHLHPR
jgi:hypothetical protein